MITKLFSVAAGAGEGAKVLNFSKRNLGWDYEELSRYEGGSELKQAVQSGGGVSIFGSF